MSSTLIASLNPNRFPVTYLASSSLHPLRLRFVDILESTQREHKLFCIRMHNEKSPTPKTAVFLGDW